MLDACLALLDTDEEKQRFTAIYNENKRLVHYIARRVLKDEQLAEDVTQDVFLRLAENFTKLSQKDGHTLRAWCVITGKNRPSTCCAAANYPQNRTPRRPTRPRCRRTPCWRATAPGG